VKGFGKPTDLTLSSTMTLTRRFPFDVDGDVDVDSIVDLAP